MTRKSMILCAALAILSPAVANAQAVPASADIATPKKGFTLKDRDGKKIGVIDTVRSDGVVTFIRDMKLYRVALATITTSGRVCTTSMSWEDIRN